MDGYLSPDFQLSIGTVEPFGGRDVWLSMSQRINFMKWRDITSGLVLIFFGWRSLTPNRPVSLWICCFISVWISMAPILFWAPTAVSYLNGTLVGALVIVRKMKVILFYLVFYIFIGCNGGIMNRISIP